MWVVIEKDAGGKKKKSEAVEINKKQTIVWTCEMFQLPCCFYAHKRNRDCPMLL